jgi:hypothetical protein
VTLVQQQRLTFMLGRFCIAAIYGETFNRQADAIQFPGDEPIMRDASERDSGRWLTRCGISVAVLMFGSLSEVAYADEGGVSYWLPGQYSSLAAPPRCRAGPWPSA